MGADESKESVIELYAKHNLWQPQYSQYENDYEKQLFMAINLIRYSPKEYGIPAVKMAAKHELAKKKKSDKLIKELKGMSQLTQVVFEDEANTACRDNNKAKIALGEATPTMGGNIDAYKTVIGDDKSPNCDEYTMCQYMGSSAFEFIGLQMILDYNREGEEAEKTPVLDPNTCKVGISNKAHPKTKNLIQILYVKSTVNTMM